jgi:hypothetical protein
LRYQGKHRLATRSKQIVLLVAGVVGFASVGTGLTLETIRIVSDPQVPQGTLRVVSGGGGAGVTRGPASATGTRPTTSGPTAYGPASSAPGGHATATSSARPPRPTRTRVRPGATSDAPAPRVVTSPPRPSGSPSARVTNPAPTHGVGSPSPPATNSGRESTSAVKSQPTGLSPSPFG